MGLGAFTGRKAAGRTADGRYLTLIDTATFAVTRSPDGTRATAQESAAARAFERSTLRTVAKYADPTAATAAGYVPVRGDAYHWVNPAFMTDDHVADPLVPESLIYYDLGDHKLSIVGAMYLVSNEDHGLDIAGPITAWHFHRYEQALCVVASGFPVGDVDADGHCDQGKAASRSPEMLHVWVANPDGPFSDEVAMPDRAAYQRAFAKLRV